MSSGRDLYLHVGCWLWSWETAGSLEQRGDFLRWIIFPKLNWRTGIHSGSLIGIVTVIVTAAENKLSGGARVVARPLRPGLLEELEHELLLLVGLGQRGNACLFQDGVLGQGRDRGRNVRGPDAVFCTRQVLHLVGDDAGGTL